MRSTECSATISLTVVRSMGSQPRSALQVLCLVSRVQRRRRKPAQAAHLETSQTLVILSDRCGVGGVLVLPLCVASLALSSHGLT